MSQSVLQPMKMAHIVFRTANYEAMLDWWTNLLGAHAVYKAEFATFLTYDDEHHRIAIINQPHLTEPRGKNISLFDHVAFTYSSLKDLLEGYKIRKAKGIVPTICINHGPTTSMYYVDPDGNRAELQVDAFATAQEGIDYMHSDEFKRNIAGKLFVPEDLIARLEAGESEESIKKLVVGEDEVMDEKQAAEFVKKLVGSNTGDSAPKETVISA
ncbi:Glyoxalase/Bleomycin resistance protein/Dihydroxybiphenyl dioxygenase [Sistotremastrum suecicum HHB10207 ss-3]|uniref:Glyoxalase/Bleomycin resistance protein/Dihydroxybiphenyl dioxygenase n=1 Tax=Sistotremastrum suecicum HHB10207 ss-3 TaxID=1314776 RepID=A0A166DFE6_9AGAM|nr:Glyoxalase/Bleomycin resistance protein/Dihydroxybiphenyl dioxygenase [Sistotremastrum suecicum HHB10207 ss-3]